MVNLIILNFSKTSLSLCPFNQKIRTKIKEKSKENKGNKTFCLLCCDIFTHFNFSINYL